MFDDMISYDDTDLHIFTIESNSEDSTSLYLLMYADKRQSLNIESILDELRAIVESDNSDDQKDEDYEELLERMGIIEIFDQDEIEDLTDDGFIDPEDLHYSIYQIVADEMDD